MILAIVQARSSSSRLPGKVLKEIQGKAMILHELERLSASRKIDKIVLATSDDPSDDVLAATVETAGYDVYRGSLDNVLARYYCCAERYVPAHVVRITGDCPVIDWRVVDMVIEHHIGAGNDYTRTSDRFPDGLDTEVMTFAALSRAYREAVLPSEREHVTPYLRNHADLFRQDEVEPDADYSSERWTVDEPQDFAFIEKVFAALYVSQPGFSMHDILRLLEEQPELRALNAGIERNEGYAKSLRDDAAGKQGE